MTQFFIDHENSVTGAEKWTIKLQLVKSLGSNKIRQIIGQHPDYLLQHVAYRIDCRLWRPPFRKFNIAAYHLIESEASAETGPI